MGKMGTCTNQKNGFKKLVKHQTKNRNWFATDEIWRRYATEPPRPPVALFRIYVSELDAPPRRGADTPPGSCAPSVHPSGDGVTNADALSTTERAEIYFIFCHYCRILLPFSRESWRRVRKLARECPDD